MYAHSADAVHVDDLTVRYESVTALHNVTLTCPTGEALGIIGPNGSGKSTLLKTVAGLLKPFAGEVCVLGSSPLRVRPGTIAYVPQIESVDFNFPVTVRDVVSMARFPRLRPLQRFGKNDRAIVEHAMAQLGIADLADRHISQLSGGQQQRTFVARALAQEPQILLLDEPTTGVDAATEDAIRRLVREKVAEGLPILMTTHEVDETAEWFDKLLILDRHVLAYGEPRSVIRSEAFATYFKHRHEHPHAHQFTRHGAAP